MSADLPVLVHVTVGFVLAYLLGFERELRGSSAGDRTFALIGTGSAIIGVLAENGAPNAVAGAITGIGFIGAGLMFRETISSQRHVVRGMTSAAGIFAASAIGAAAGQGHLALATLGTVLALLTLELRYTPGLRALGAEYWTNRFHSEDADPQVEDSPRVPEPR